MKKLILTICTLTICLFTLPAFAEEVFTPITKDNEVQDLDAVQVKKAIVVQQTSEEILTMRKIDERIAKKQDRITHLQGDIAALQGDIVELQALRDKVQVQAEKVVLKPIVEPKFIEPIEEVK